MPFISRLRVTSAVHVLSRSATFARHSRSSHSIARLVSRYSPTELRRRRELTRSAGQRLNDSAAMLSFSVLADSAMEHYRGSFQKKTMYAPLAVAALSLGASLFGRLDPRASKHTAVQLFPDNWRRGNAEDLSSHFSPGHSQAWAFLWANDQRQLRNRRPFSGRRRSCGRP
jgi:hypothetical protein